MDLRTMDKMAYKGLPMPGGLDEYDKQYYKLVSDVYSGCRYGTYTEAEGKAMKADLVEAYNLIRECQEERNES